MDTGGQGVLVEQSQLHLSLGLKAESFTFEKFRHTCILSGCDYLDSLPGIGLVKASKFFALSSNPNLHQALSRIPSYLRMPKLVVSNEYKESFVKADNTFLYQLVFCPLTKRLAPLNPYPSYLDPSELNYAGRYFPNDLAVELAKGNINVSNLQRFPEPISTPKHDKVPKRHHNWEVSDIPESIWNSKYEVKEPKSVVIDDKHSVLSTKGHVVSAKMPLAFAGSNKRKFESKETVIDGPSDQDLLSIYKSDVPQAVSEVPESPEKPHKKIAKCESFPRSPLSDRSQEMSNSPELDTKRLSPRKNSFSVRKTSLETSSSPVVRSRFFWNPASQTLAKGASSVSIWEKIEEPTPSENTPPRKVTLHNPFAKQWSSDSSNLKNSPKVNFPFKSVKVLEFSNSEPSSDHAASCETKLPKEEEEEVQGTGTDAMCGQDLDESILSQKTNRTFTEEPLSDFEEPVSQKSTNLSQLTVCSIDNDSFDLSQVSSNSVVSLHAKEGCSTTNFKKQIPVRRVGLSKKKKQPALTAGQLSLKEAFAKFRYIK